jgi:uncharacterized protein
MALTEQLLKILACPEDKTPLRLATADEVTRINSAIHANSLKNRGGESVTEPVEGGLIRADGKFFYPIRREIPILLVNEALPV